MDLDLGNTRTLALTPARSTVTMTPIVAQGERGEQGLPGVASAAWTALTAVTTGTTRQAPDGSWIKSLASRTTRASFDATEEAFWDVVFATEGTLEFDALERFVSYLPVPNGEDDTAVLQAAVDAGGYIKARPGTYLTTGILITSPVWLELDTATTIKLKDNTFDPDDSDGLCVPINISSDGVAITGGVIDGNRSGQDKETFNSTGGANGGNYVFGITVEGTAMNPITNLIIDTHFVECVDSGVHALHVQGPATIKADVSDSGSGVQLITSEDVRLDVTCHSIDNDGWRVYPHILDLNQCSKIDVDLTSIDHAGDDSLDDEETLSLWNSGVTAINCSDVTFNTMRVDFRDDNTMNRGVGISFLSCRAFTVYGTKITGASDVAIELGGVIDSQFIGGVIDGRYNTGTESFAGRGISAYNIGLVRDLSHRVTRYTDNVTFSDFIVERQMGDALVIEAARNMSFVNSKFRSSQRGVLAKYAANGPTESVAQTARPITGLMFVNCDFKRNEQSGFDAYDLTQSKFFGCNFDRNGQVNSGGGVDSTHTRNGQLRDTAAAGFKTRTSTSPLGNKEGIEFHGCKFDETQYDTGLAGPAVTYGSIDPSDPAVVSLADDVVVSGAGQTIKLIGAGVGAVDLTTMVDDSDLDEVTLHVATSTQPTVSGSGTISSSGTTITGTTFTTQFNARYWITAAGQTRRVVKVASATSATTDTAFSPALSAGTSFVIHKVEVRAIPSQQYAALFSADTIAPRFYGGTNPVGNVQGVFSDANSSNTSRARYFGIPGQVSYFGNTVQSAGNLVAGAGGGSDSTLGTVGPSTEPAIKLGGDVTLYRESATALKTAARITQSGTALAYVKFTTSGSVGPTRDTIDGDAALGAITLTLTSAASNPGQVFTLRKSDSSGNAVTVATSSSQTIDGVSTKSLTAQYQMIRVQSDGANWVVI